MKIDEYGEYDEVAECFIEEEEGMYIKLHGGACCGVKHIHEMGSSPTTIRTERKPLADDATSYARHPVNGVNDAHAADYPQDFFCQAAPKEKGSERLDRLVDFIKSHRSHGIIEIVITSGQSAWFPALEERGFKRVTPENGVCNSNTSNMLHVFHLYH